MIFIVEKQIDGEWYLEGKGDIDYVNRVIDFYTPLGTIVRISIEGGN